MRVRLEDIPPEGLKIETVADPADSAVAGLEMEGPLSGSFYIRKAGAGDTGVQARRNHGRQRQRP